MAGNTDPASADTGRGVNEHGPSCQKALQQLQVTGIRSTELNHQLQRARPDPRQQTREDRERKEVLCAVAGVLDFLFQHVDKGL